MGALTSQGGSGDLICFPNLYSFRSWRRHDRAWVHGGRRGVRELESGSLGQLGDVSEAGVKQALGSCQLQAYFTRGVPIPRCASPQTGAWSLKSECLCSDWCRCLFQTFNSSPLCSPCSWFQFWPAHLAFGTPALLLDHTPG